MGESQTVVSRKQSTPNFKKPVSSLQKTPFLLQNAAGIIKNTAGTTKWVYFNKTGGNIWYLEDSTINKLCFLLNEKSSIEYQRLVLADCAALIVRKV